MNVEHPQRRAFNLVVMPDGSRIAPAVCTFDKQGTVVSVESLNEELPFVEWVGGKLYLRQKMALSK
ncbi:MAG: hypothetical protein IJ209_08405 [Bacteroidaceae bacterium]|nr:hypothetical protein [Bacteroidaceae bacterium]